jgi:hypothetical protein
MNCVYRHNKIILIHFSCHCKKSGVLIMHKRVENYAYKKYLELKNSHLKI